MTGVQTCALPIYVYTANSSYADISTAGSDSNYLQISGYNFSIPTGATINGYVVEIKRYDGDNGSGYQSYDSSVRLLYMSSAIGGDKASSSVWPTTPAYATYGSSSDTWGASLTANQVDASEFGVALAVKGNPARVDHVRMTVYYTPLGASVYDSFMDLIRTLFRKIS